MIQSLASASLTLRSLSAVPPYGTSMTHPRTSMRTLTLALILATGPVVAQWQKLPPMPTPSGGFSCGADEKGILVMGGTNWEGGTKQWLQSISRFDPQTMRWDTLASLSAPLAYAMCSAWQSDDSLVILGGSNGQAPLQKIIIVAQAKPAAESLPALPQTLVLSAGGIVKDDFIIVGGTHDAANVEGFTRHTLALNLKTKALTTLPDYPGKAFGLAACAVLGTELFVFGGANWNAETKAVANTATSYAFDNTAKQWRKLTPYPLAARGPTAVALDEHHIYIAGGYGGEPEGFLSTAFIYDRRSDSYAPATPLPYAATVGLVRRDGFVYCFGGEDKMKSRTAAAWRLRVADLLK